MKTALTTLALAVVIAAPAAAQSTTIATNTGTAIKVDNKVSASLAASVKVSADSALALALAAVPDGEISSGKLEMEDGRLVYSFKALQKNKGATQVRFDAMTGELVKDRKLGGIKAMIEHQNENRKLLDAKRDSAKKNP